MFRFIPLIFAAMVFSAPALAQEWPPEAKMQMQAAGARLETATTTAERVVALREIESIAAAYPDAPDARITAFLMSEKATMEAGPGVMLDALGELAASGQITDVDTLAGIAEPLLSSIEKMRDEGTLLPSVAIGLDDAISKLNAATAKAGLPSVADAISQVSGDPALGKALTDSLGRVAKLAKAARAAPNLAELDKKATKEFLDNIAGSLPAGAGITIGGPGFVVFRDSLAWDNEMFGQSAKALDLVADAIETGKFDHEAYNKISDRLKELSKGPWDSDTAKDILKSLCKAIPIIGAWCDDAFKLAEELVSPVSCSAITCDCENVGGGIMRGPLIVSCKLQEQDLINQCQATKTVTGSCDPGAKGPDANY